MKEDGFALLACFVASFLILKGLCQTCDPTWLVYNEECFKYFEENVVHSETTQRCASKGALPVLSSADKLRDFLAQHTVQHGNSSYWCSSQTEETEHTVTRDSAVAPISRTTTMTIGRTTTRPTGRQTIKPTGRMTAWPTGRMTTRPTGRQTKKPTERMTAWPTGRMITGRMTTRPTGRTTTSSTSWNRDQTCCYIQRRAVHEGRCSGQRGFICQKDARSPPGTCPQGTENLGASCFWKIPVLLNRAQAEGVCSSRGGWLANLKSRQKIMYAYGAVNVNGKDFWVGARNHSLAVKWSTGEIFDLEAYKNLIPIQNDGNGNCIRLGLSNMTKSKTTWIIGDCRSFAYALCEGAASISSPMATTTITTTPPETTTTPTLHKKECPHQREKDGTCFWETRNETPRFDWDTARQYCKGYGGDLASYRNAQEENFALWNSKGSKSRLWLGLRRDPGSQVFRWSDGSPLTYTNWAPGQPKLEGNSRLCVAHSGARSRWEVIPCGYVGWFVCKMAKASIPETPVVPTQEPVIHCSRPPGSDATITWSYYNGYCYTINRKRPFTWETAKTFCQDNGAYLASFHSTKENNFIISLLSSFTGYTNYWIGLRARGLHSSYQWDDGSAVNFINWDEYDIYDDRGNTDTCVSYDLLSGFWHKHECGYLNYVICKAINGSDYKFTTPLPALSLPGYCPDEWHSFGNKCYKIFGLEAKQPWHGADAKCREIGSSLASIHSDEEQDFLSLLVLTVRYDTWIGLYATIGGRLFRWEDHSSVDYTHWASGEPNNDRSQEKCVHLKYQNANLGRWNDYRCTSSFAYICQIPKDPMLTKPGQDPFLCTKPQGWLKLQSTCYKIYNESYNRLTWVQAQSFCLSVAGNLASVKNFGITILLRNHLATQDDVFWIGMRDTEKNIYAWLGSTPLSYTNWLKDQPKRVSDLQNCVAVNAEGKWMVRDCYESHPFICEESPAVPTIAPHEPDMICPNSSEKWKDLGGKICYIIEQTARKKWSDAEHFCVKEGGALASIHSAEEMKAILHHIKQTDMPVHIGLGQKEDGSFEWIDGSAVDYVNWAPGEPNSAQEMCVEMYSDAGAWNDVTCSERRGFVCSTAKVPREKDANSAGLENKDAESLRVGISAGGIVGIIICLLVVIAIIALALYYLLPCTRMRARRFSEPTTP